MVTEAAEYVETKRTMINDFDERKLGLPNAAMLVCDTSFFNFVDHKDIFKKNRQNSGHSP